MPELPEVETIRNQLQAHLPFAIQHISSSAHLPSLLHPLQQFPLETLKGKTVQSIERWGKWLIFCFSPQRFLLSHLGMSGSWRISREGPLQEKHVHLQWKGQGQDQKYQLHLGYCDPRRFGHLALVSASGLQELKQRLGLDLLDPQLDGDYVFQQCQRYPQRPIKGLLMDQQLFAGSGNYICNEICAHAGIMPTRLCHNINPIEAQKIARAIATVLATPLANGGTTFSGGYRDTAGQRGEGVKGLVVFYQKVCGLCQRGKVEKIYLQGRGTYFCPRCQK